MTKFITVDEAAELIKDGSRLGIGGFATFGSPDSLLRAIRRRYVKTNSPKNLFVVAPCCTGDKNPEGWGMSALGPDGDIIDTLITSQVSQAPYIAKAIWNNEIACFLLPLGIFTQIFHALTAKRPGVVTNTGKYTYVDPRVEGGKANQRAIDSGIEVVKVVEFDGKEYLYYPTIPMDACIIRATYSDESGNISMKKEVIPAEQVEMAEAVHNNGGIVIVQVEKILKDGSLHPREVVLHKSFVDYVVEALPGEQPHTYGIPEFSPELMGDIKIPVEAVAPMNFSIRKVIARRGAMELKKGVLVNLGLGISDGVSLVANEEGFANDITLTIETGLFGGIPMTGQRMGSGINSEATLKTDHTFDLYDGGVLDIAFLSGAEIDEHGNVNVSKFGGRAPGPGGFINISQNVPKICFLGTFTAGKEQDIRFEDGKVHIVKDGSLIKFRKNVEQITFSGRYSKESGQKMMVITERAVFQLTQEGLELIEIAPGIDLEKDILGKMEFKPIISKNLKLMEARLFKDEKMGLEIN